MLMVACAFATGIGSCSNTADTSQEARTGKTRQLLATPVKKASLADKKQLATG